MSDTPDANDRLKLKLPLRFADREPVVRPAPEPTTDESRASPVSLNDARARRAARDQERAQHVAPLFDAPPFDDVPPPGDEDAPSGPKRARKKKLRSDPPKSGEAPAAARLTDAGNAELLAKLHGNDLRFCQARGGWLVWSGSHWVEDSTKEVHRRAAAIPFALWKEASDAGGRGGRTEDGLDASEVVQWALDSRSSSRHQAMVKLAEHQAGIAVAHETFDRELLLLNAQNGTVDLRTGELRAHRREDLMTGCAPTRYDANARAPRFEKFLEEALPDADVRKYVQRFCGYCATGVVREHVLVVFFGELGRNGKGTLIRTLEKVLGKLYVKAVSNDLVLVKNGNQPHPTHRYTLLGARLAYFSETADGSRFDAAELKRLTGGDMINARRMHKDEFLFEPTAKLLLQTNRKPKADAGDQAFWERMHLVEWPVSFADRIDHTLEPTIQGDGDRDAGERAGVLRWIVEGALEWQRIGLAPPTAITDATKAYRTSEDVVARFLDERTEKVAVHVGAKVKIADLFRSFQKWCDDNGERSGGTSRAFAEQLKRYGCEHGTSTGGYPTIRDRRLTEDVPRADTRYGERDDREARGW